MKFPKKDTVLAWMKLKRVAIYSLGIIISLATITFISSVELNEKIAILGKYFLILLFAGAISIESNVVVNKITTYLNKSIHLFSKFTLRGVVFSGSILISIYLYQLIGNIIAINLSVIVTLMIGFILWLEVKLLPGNKIAKN